MQQIDIIRKMSPAQRLREAFRLYAFARELKYAGLRRKYPELTQDKLDAKLREAFLHARS